MKVAAGQGLHSAFWAKPENDWWPPELDVEEIAGGLTHQVTTTVHWRECGVHLSQNHDFVGPDFSQDYHVFGAEWTPSGTTWYVDGVEVFQTSAGTAHMSEQGPLYMILNFQTNLVGGERTDASTPWPSYQYIDYVRVWARPPAPPPAGGQPPSPPPPVCPQPPPAPPAAGAPPPPVPPGAGAPPPPAQPGAGGHPPSTPPPAAGASTSSGPARRQPPQKASAAGRRPGPRHGFGTWIPPPPRPATGPPMTDRRREAVPAPFPKTPTATNHEAIRSAL